MLPQNPNLLVPQVFEIFQGDSKALPLKLVYKGTFSPFDLTKALEIEVNLPITSGGFTSLKLTLGQVAIVGSAVLGQISATIPQSVSTTLQPGTLQEIFVVVTLGDGTNINVTAGLTVGNNYVIQTVGTTTPTEWQALGLPTTVTPAVGVVFTCNSATPGVGTGVVQTLPANSPITVPFRKCFSVFE